MRIFQSDFVQFIKEGLISVAAIFVILLFIAVGGLLIWAIIYEILTIWRMS